MHKLILESPFEMHSLVRYRFTVDQYEKMIASGILDENDRVELIRGEILEKMVASPRHSATVNRLNRLLNTRLTSAIVSVKNPIALSDSVPEPDLALLLRRDDFFATANPKASDVMLVIEVADSSLAYDREIKLPLYAQAGIQEFWIVNLNKSKVEVYRQPQPEGVYLSQVDFSRGQTLSSLEFPEVLFEAGSILG